MTTKLLYRPSEVMTLLGIGSTKFWGLVKEGKLESRKIGRATVIPAESVKTFINALPKAT